MSPFFKNNIIIIILILIASSFVYCGTVVSDNTGSQEKSISSDESVPSPTETDLAEDESPTSPSTGGGSGGIPYAKYNFTISAEPKKPLRNTSVLLNMTLRNNELSRLTVQFIKLQITRGFELIKYHQENSSDRIPLDVEGNVIWLGPFNLEGNETKIFKYELKISNNIKINNTSLFSLEPELKFKRHLTLKSSERIDSEIDIQNNPPRIHSAEAFLPENQFEELNDNSTLLFTGNVSRPIEALFRINAYDIEDGNKLKFIGFTSSKSGENLVDLPSLNIFHNSSEFKKQIEDIQSGGNYVLWSLVKDNNNEINKTLTTINHKGRHFQSFLIPDVQYCENLATTIAIIVPILFIFVVILIFRFCSKRIFRIELLFLIIIIIWSLYVWSLSFEPQDLFGTRNFVFFNSLPFFELAVYLTIFFIICYFTEACFSIEDRDLPTKSLSINFVFMFIILASFMFLIPKITNLSSYLSSYYGTMSTVFGTIFGLMVTLSGQFPKNILIFNSRNSNERLSNHCFLNNNISSYHEKIRYFVGLYGVALGFSLLGLVAGISTKFNTLVLELSRENLTSLISIALFEITFLLIPPTILSLYHLLQVISFRGKICIKSKPSNAELSISGRHDYNDPNDKIDAPIFNDIDLTTPCTLYLPSGKYKIKLKYKINGMQPKEEIIAIRDGMEKEYTFEASNELRSDDAQPNSDSRS